MNGTILALGLCVSMAVAALALAVLVLVESPVTHNQSRSSHDLSVPTASP
jgi:hypothetical protein